MQTGKRGLSSFELSAIAAACMTVDHFAVVFAADHWAYFGMRAIGRISFVIFAFLLADSVDKTSSVKRFCGRLLVFAVISEPVFDMAFYGTWYYAGHQNIFFTLLTGVVCSLAAKRKSRLSAAVIAAVAFSAQLGCFDYGWSGVLLIVAFAVFDKKYAWIVTAAFAVIFMLMSGEAFGLFALLAVPFIGSYNGLRGGESAPVLRKWGFYAYYPLHLSLICGLWHYMITCFT